MKTMKKSTLLIALTMVLGLASCGPNANPDISIPEFDPNEYETEVSIDVAKKRVINAIENSGKIDEMRTISEIHNLEYGNSLLDVLEQTSSKTETKVKLKEVSNISGLQATDPNAIMESTSLKDIELTIIKAGICPEEDDHIEMMGGFADIYLKNNNQYVSLTDKTLRDFMPYVLFGFGDYKTIEDAKKEASKVPEKFYDPTPINKEENLPLGGAIGNLKQEDMSTMFDYILELNDATSKDFLTFKSKDDNLLMNINLTGEQIRDVVAKILKSINPDFNEKVFILSFNQYVKINAFDLYFNLDKNDKLTYQKINIDFNFNSMQKDENDRDFLRNDYLELDMESHLEYKDIIVKYPKDIDSYQKYDLSLPNIPELPSNL